VCALILKFSDGATEGALELSDLRRDQLREAQEHRRANSAPGQIIDYLF